MKTLTIIAFVLLSQLSFSQCKYEINKVDKFTKHTIIKTKYANLWQDMLHSLTFKAIKMDSIKYLEMTYATSSIYSIEKESKLMFLLSNDSIITLNALESETANYYSAGIATVWSVPVRYKLLEGDYQSLLKGIVASIRYYTPDGYIEKDIKSKRGRNLNKILACI